MRRAEATKIRLENVFFRERRVDRKNFLRVKVDKENVGNNFIYYLIRNPNEERINNEIRVIFQQVF